MSLSLTFHSPPSIWTAYRRVLLGKRSGLKDPTDIPHLRASWSGVKVEPDSLARYRKTCSVEDEPGLPIHYPHVLVSPMHLTMMTEPEFPLALMGSLHLRNHAIRYRPIDPSETLLLSSEMADCRFRPQGIEFDLDTTMHSGDEKVWAERTTFLVRKKLKQEDPASPLAEVFPWDEEAGVTELDSFEVPPKAGKTYASITGDYNPIHVSKLLAKAFGFKRDLVHGLWGVAKATSKLEELKSDQAVRVDISFKGPLFMTHQVSVKTTPCPGGRSLRLFCGNDPRPAVQVVVRAVSPDSKPEDVPPA